MSFCGTFIRAPSVMNTRFRACAWCVAESIDICTGRCFRSGLMSHAGPPECLPTGRKRRPLEWLEWLSPPRFSFVCLLKILGPEIDSQDQAIVFSLSSPIDRVARGRSLLGDGEE